LPCHKTAAALGELYKRYTAKIDCLVLEKIMNNLPRTSFEAGNLNIPGNIALTDVNFNVSGPIDLLLGAQLFLELIRNGKIQLGPHLYLQNTHFGWIAAGDINIPSNTSKFITCNLSIKGQELQYSNTTTRLENFGKLSLTVML
jgi:hypothetical protein